MIYSVFDGGLDVGCLRASAKDESVPHGLVMEPGKVLRAIADTSVCRLYRNEEESLL